MPTIKSAEKAMRVSRRRRAINSVTTNKYKTAVKEVRDAIKAGNKSEAEEKFQNAQKQLDKAVKKEVIHKNKSARLKSRLSKKIQNLGK